MTIQEKYNNNETAKVGEICTCPSCGTSFTKKTYNQKFCKRRSGSKCRDKYWNTVDPRKRNNTTRISPASQTWLDRRRERTYDYDQGWDAHKNY